MIVKMRNNEMNDCYITDKKKVSMTDDKFLPKTIINHVILS